SFQLGNSPRFPGHERRGTGRYHRPSRICQPNPGLPPEVILPKICRSSTGSPRRTARSSLTSVLASVFGLGSRTGAKTDRPGLVRLLATLIAGGRGYTGPREEDVFCPPPTRGRRGAAGPDQVGSARRPEP